MPKRPRGTYGYQASPQILHEGDHLLPEARFRQLVSALDAYAPRMFDPQSGVDLHSLWTQTMVPLARDLLPTKDLAALVAGYTHGSVRGFNDMDRETRVQLMQSVLTRLAKKLKQGGGSDGGGEGQGQGGSGQSGQPQQGQAKPQKHQPKKPEKPKQWSQMTPRERQQLREAIEKGQVSDQKPQQGTGQEIDPRSLPRDLAQKLQQQAQERARQHAQPHPQSPAQRTPGQSSQAGPGGPGNQAPSPAAGQPADGRMDAPSPAGAAASPPGQDGRGEESHQPPVHAAANRQEVGAGGASLQEKLAKAKEAQRINTGQQAQGGGEKKGENPQPVAAGPGQAEKPESSFEKLDDQDWASLINEMTTTNPDNTSTGFQSIEEMLQAVGYGGGGPAMDLRLPMKTTEERLFHTIQEAFLRLGGEPDASDKTPDGSDVWSAKRIAIARWKPHLLPMAKDDFVKSPEDIYFVLDTSGSVSHYANVIAAMAAGALGLVHLFHGSEAHPQYQILRATPLKHPRDFKGLGKEYGLASEKDQHQPAEKQRDIANPGNPLYNRWLTGTKGRRDVPMYRSDSWETSVEFWLKTLKPARGSRLIFWGDTMSVGFQDPLRIQRLLKPYRFVWMLPFGLEEYKRHYGRYGDDHLPSQEDLLARPRNYSSCEYLKLQAVGLQVIGNANSPEGLRNALRKVR